MIWLILILPMLVPILSMFYYGRNRSVAEYGIHALITIVVTCSVFYAGKYFPALDKEILNGYVTDKKQVYNPRTEYYDCNCRTVTSGSGKNKTSSRQCDTCTRIIPEWDWRVFTTVGSLTISRIDSSGRREPPRWTAVKINECASLENTYINQIKGVKDSIFHYDKDLIKNYKIPEYPSVTDYYRFNHVINQTDVDTKGWNEYISERLKTLGTQKQLNIIVVLTNKDYGFFDALKYEWLGGKKNDVLLVFGLDKNKVSWFGSTSLADGYKNQTLHANLRMNAIDRVADMSLLGEQINIIERDFVRVPMEEFDYLTSESDPPTWIMVLATVLGVLSSVGASLLLERFGKRVRF